MSGTLSHSPADAIYNNQWYYILADWVVWYRKGMVQQSCVLVTFHYRWCASNTVLQRRWLDPKDTYYTVSDAKSA